MRILLIHNRYKQSGGEDSVFQAESDLLKQHGNEVGHLRYENSLIKTLMDKCISGILTIYNPVSAHVLKVKILDFNPDVIHVHNFLPLISPSVFSLAKKLDIPIILTLHNYRLICPSATLFFRGKIYEKSIHSIFPFDAIWKGVYRNSRIQTAIVVIMIAINNSLGTWKSKVSGYIALTRFAKEKFVDSSISILESKIFIKPNFVADSGKGNLVRENFFLFIGRLTPEKGIETLIKAVDIYKFKLVIIGDGPMKKMVEDAAVNNSSVTYLGLQPRLTVIDYLKRCRALLFPSIWYEGFPVTILEAFSTSTPVIASNLGSMKEIIQDKVNGLHFKPGDELDLISKIISISENKDLALSMSSNARMSYEENYTPSKNYEQLERIYKSVISKGMILESNQRFTPMSVAS
ncbi:MAG TPA: glycosyltransferase family 4 protein [Cyclobacteriaceae bacterium]|nr:glycosyltransferase family 4 protein [Cyclobacteriaceae bacterium]